MSAILEEPGANKLFDSSDIPGEIIDLMVVNTETLAANPDFGKALVGAWYEVMGLMAAGDEEVLTAMAEASGTDLAGYKAQLASTEMFYDPGRCGGFHQGCRSARRRWSTWPSSCSTRASSAKARRRPISSASPIPMAAITGDANNVTFRYDTTYMQMAADGAL